MRPTRASLRGLAGDATAGKTTGDRDGAAAPAATPSAPAPASAAGRRVGRSGVKRGAGSSPLAGEPPPARRRSARVRGEPPALIPQAFPSPCRSARPAARLASPSPLASSPHEAGYWPGLLDLPTDLLLRMGGQLPPADLFALAGTCKTARATLGRGAWVRLFECVCLPTVAALDKGPQIVSPASPAGAVGPPRQLVGPDEDTRQWHLGRHTFSAIEAEAEARRIVELISAVSAVKDEGLMVRVDLAAQFRMAVNVGWAVYNEVSLPLVLASSRVAPAAAGPGTLVYQVLPINAARRFWHVTDYMFADPPVNGTGVPNTGALSAELRTVGGLTRAVVRHRGSVSGLLKTASRIQVRADKMAARIATNRGVVEKLGAERRLDRFPGAVQVACDCVSVLKDFVAGRTASDMVQNRVTEALDAVTAAYEALSPSFLYRVMRQTGGPGLWLNERHQWGWTSCLRKCVAASAGSAKAIAVEYEQNCLD